MEYEVRFYLNKNRLDQAIEKLDNSNLEKSLRTYEKTSQYNHCDSNYNFYSKEIDGRFRIRVSKNDETSKCKLSWKRRLSDTTSTNINKEEEKELTIKYEEYENLLFIVEKVMHFELVESYERYRTVYENEEIEIAIDEYPFGIALELESKKESEFESIIEHWVNLLGLDIKKAYRLSWDDKYQELCKEQNIECYKEVSFSKPMPTIIE